MNWWMYSVDKFTFIINSPCIFPPSLPHLLPPSLLLCQPHFVKFAHLIHDYQSKTDAEGSVSSGVDAGYNFVRKCRKVCSQLSLACNEPLTPLTCLQGYYEERAVLSLSLPNSQSSPEQVTVYCHLLLLRSDITPGLLALSSLSLQWTTARPHEGSGGLAAAPALVWWDHYAQANISSGHWGFLTHTGY